MVGSKAFINMALTLLVYLILSALYEKWVLPISIMLAVPYGGQGFVVRVIPFLNNNVFFQIGLLHPHRAIGQKCDTGQAAEEQRREGKSIYDATMEAARLRFRPMMMTSVARRG